MRFADYFPNINGDAVKVRADDGVHFTRARADRVATVVFDKLQKVREITSWKKENPTTTTPTTAAPVTPTTRVAVARRSAAARAATSGPAAGQAVP